MDRIISDLKGTKKSSFLIGSTYSAPTLDNEAAPKKYVDDLLVPADQVIIDGVNVDPGYDVTLDKVIDYLWSSGQIFGFALTPNGDGSVDLASGIVMLRETDTMSPYYSKLIACKIDATTDVALTDNTTNFIYAQYHATTPFIGVATDITTIHATNKVLLYVITRVGTQLDYLAVGPYASDFMAKYAKKIVARNKGAEYAYGCITSEADTRKLSITSGCFYYVNEQIPTSAFNTNTGDTFTYCYRNGSGGFTRVSAQTTIDNTYYDSGTGTLATLDNSKYGIHWVFLVLDSPTRIMVVYGQAQYADVASADAAGVPTILPPEVQSYSTGVLIAKIIVKKAATNLYSIQNPFTTIFHSAVATEHNGLSNLQGGTTDEYYHLTDAQNADVSGATNEDTVSTLVKRDTLGGFKASSDIEVTDAAKGLILKSGSQRIRIRIDYTDSVPQLVFDVL